jgi:hypothetical protein
LKGKKKQLKKSLCSWNQSTWLALQPYRPSFPNWIPLKPVTFNHRLSCPFSNGRLLPWDWKGGRASKLWTGWTKTELHEIWHIFLMPLWLTDWLMQNPLEPMIASGVNWKVGWLHVVIYFYFQHRFLGTSVDQDSSNYK